MNMRETMTYCGSYWILHSEVIWVPAYSLWEWSPLMYVCQFHASCLLCQWVGHASDSLKLSSEMNLHCETSRLISCFMHGSCLWYVSINGSSLIHFLVHNICIEYQKTINVTWHYILTSEYKLKHNSAVLTTYRDIQYYRGQESTIYYEQIMSR